MRTNVVLAIIVVVLAVPSYLTYRAQAVEFTDYAEVPRLFDGFTPANVARVVVSEIERDPQGEIALDDAGSAKRKGIDMVRVAADRWVLGEGSRFVGVSIAPGKVYEAVLQHVEAMRLDEKAVVQTDADAAALQSYGLDEEHAMLVQTLDANNAPLAQLLVGKDASEGQAGDEVVRGFYVRRTDSTDVLLYEQSYWVLSIQPNEWIDQRPLRFPMDEVVGLELENDLGRFAVYKDRATDVDWKVREVLQPDPDTGQVVRVEVGAPRLTELSSFLLSVGALQIQDYVDPLPRVGDPAREALLKANGLDAPRVKITIKLADGIEHVVQVGSQLSGTPEYFLLISSVDFLMTVGDWVVGQFEKKDPSFFFDPR